MLTVSCFRITVTSEIRPLFPSPIGGRYSEALLYLVSKNGGRYLHVVSVSQFYVPVNMAHLRGRCHTSKDVFGFFDRQRRSTLRRPSMVNWALNSV